MAELNLLETKLGEVLGLAQAAQVATQQVASFFDDDSHPEARLVSRMHDEAAETEARTMEVAESFEGKKTAIQRKAREVKGEGREMLEAYLAGEDDPLEGFEFLSMVEAGEATHWAILKTLNEKAGHEGVERLTEWALPIQRRHAEQAVDGALDLAADEDPSKIEEEV